ELAKNPVRVDCDVDASNFYLFYEGEVLKDKGFSGGKVARIDTNLCTQCGLCEEKCKFDAIKDFVVDPARCEGCGVCKLVCPSKAVIFEDYESARIYIEKLQDGLICRANMEPGSEGSVKLVTDLRKTSLDFAEDDSLVISDGSPGIGCQVIASVTNIDTALIVTEPTMSALHDFLRIVELCKFFGAQVMVCINKCDLNESVSSEIEKYCESNNIEVVGKIPYDSVVMQSINELKPIVYYENSIANKAIRKMWQVIKLKIEDNK
ncbi:MAG: ATP-binding protein, partial [Eubacteriales bacterium]